MHPNLIDFISPLRYFDHRKSSLMLDRFNIFKESQIIESIFGDLEETFGKFYYQDLLANYNIGFHGYNSKFEFLRNLYPMSRMVKLLTMHASNMVNALWFIKDNSVSIGMGVCCTASKIACYQLVSVNSNCFGNYDVTSFSNEDIEATEAILPLIMPFFVEVPDDILDKSHDTTVSPLNYVTYGKDINRLSRVLNFLVYARTNSFIPQKIAFYIAILECLFTTDHGEITHKVSERTAFYIGGNKDEKVKNFDLIKKGYSIRSKYVHGQLLEKKHSEYDSLILISNNLDNLLRIVLNKVFKDDSACFLKNDTDLNNWFRDLIFS